MITVTRFGLEDIFQLNGEELITHIQQINLKLKKYFYKMISFRYPPESLEYGRFSEQSDIWSYGVTVYEIFSYGLDPILPGLSSNTESDAETDNTKMKEMLDLLNKGVRLPCPEACPQSVYTQLMLPCWEIQPQNRPSFRSLLGDIMKVETNLF